MGIDLISNIQPAPGGAGLFPTHWDTYGRGGYQVRATIVDRDSIPPLNRREGMVAFVVADGVEYRLNADLLTWSIAGGGGGGTLAGDVTGPAASNVVERLTGLAGVVTAPAASISFGSAPATTGRIRLTSGDAIRTTTSNFTLLTNGGGFWQAGGSEVGNNIGFLMVATGGSIRTQAGSSLMTYVSTTGSLFRYYISNVEWDETVALPRIGQGAKTTDTLSQDITIQSQQPYSLASGAPGGNTVPGSINLDTGTPTNSGVQYGYINMRGNGINFFRFIHTGGGIPRMYVKNAAGTSDILVVQRDGINSVNFGDGSNALITSLAASSRVDLNIGGGSIMQINSTAIVPIVSSILWNISTVSPLIGQSAKNVDALPQDLTLRPQQPFSGASGGAGGNTKPGNLVVDLGTPAGAGTSYGALKFVSGATNIAYFTRTNTDFRMYYGAAGASDPYIQLNSTGGWLVKAQVGSNSILDYGAGGNFFIQAGGVTQVQVSGSVGVFNSTFGYSFANTVVSPSVGQVTPSSNVQPQPLLIIPQTAYTGATGATNGKPGDLRFGMGTRIDTATGYGRFEGKLGPATGVTQWSMRSVLEGSATNGVYIIGGDSTATDAYLGLYGGGGGVVNVQGSTWTMNAGTHWFTVGGVQKVSISATVCSMQALTQLTAPLLITAANTGAWTIAHSNRNVDIPPPVFNIYASAALSNSTGTNQDGGQLRLAGGTRDLAVPSTTGRSRGVAIMLSVNSPPSIEVGEVTQGSTAIVMHATGFMTGGILPANTGDKIVFLGDADTVPSANAVAGHIYYSESARPAWRFNSTNFRLDGTAATATAGTGALPAGPEGFLEVTIDGTTRKIPYYNA